MTASETALVLLATADQELGQFAHETAHTEASKLADELQTTVTIRDPTSDEVLMVVEPTIKTETETPKKGRAPKAKVEPKAKKAPAKKADKAPDSKKADKAPTSKKADKEPKAAKAKGDTMAERCLELAMRNEGVTPAELNDLTKWKGAPWKWLFTNPKGTGWVDKRPGLKFDATKEQREGSTRATSVYRVVKAK